MSDAAFDQYVSGIEMLSYGQRVTLLKKLVASFSEEEKKTAEKITAVCDDAFGIWADYDVSLGSIREKAWGRR